MVFIDSDMLINCMKSPNSKNKEMNATRERAKEILEDLFNRDPGVKTTVFNVAELHAGAYRSTKVAENLQKVERFLEPFEIVYPSLESAKENAKLCTSLDAKGTHVDFSDLWIACIVMVEHGVLYTKNVAHFEKIPGLKVIDWSKAKPQ